MPSPRTSQVVYSYLRGGSEVLAWRLARNLNATGRFRCSVDALSDAGPLVQDLQADAIPHAAFPRRHALDIALLAALTRHFRRERVRLVHTHHLGQLLYGGTGARLSGARLIHTEHEFYSLQRPLHRRLLRAFAGLAHVVTTISAEVTRFLVSQVGIPGARLRTIPNGVESRRFREAVPLSRSDLGWDDRTVIVGCVARLEAEKGQRMLLEAFAAVHRGRPESRLLLVGDGAERGELETVASTLGIASAVRFLGTRGDIPEIVAACDIVALASRHEGLPLALLEGMAGGHPAIATAVGSVGSIVRDDDTGYLVPPGDAVSFADRLDRLVGDEGLRRRLGENAAAMVSQSYDFDVVAGAYGRLYESVLAGSS